MAFIIIKWEFYFCIIAGMQCIYFDSDFCLSLCVSLYMTVQRSAAAFEQEVRERATVLQTDFENYVHANNESLQTAKSGKPTS